MEEIYDKYGSDTRSNEINITPLKRGRRILIFLGDLFVNLIMCMLIMNIAVMPITKAASSYNDKTDEMYDRTEDIADILRGNNLLYYENDSEKTYLTTSMYYTAEKFIEYYTTGEGSQYEIFYNYYIDIREDQEAYLDVYRESDYFVVEGTTVSLLPYYQELLMSFYRIGDSPSNEAETLYEDIIDVFFNVAFDEMIGDIAVNDLYWNGLSYNEVDDRLAYLVAYCDNMIVLATYISFFLCSIVCFLIIPLCNHNGKTITMMVLHTERIGINNLYLLKKGEVAIQSIFSMVCNLVFIMFIPWPTVNFNYLFGLGSGQFMILSGISLLIILASLIMMLFSQYNQTLFDRLTRTVMISTDSLDEIYRAKGYKV
ncbi:MAG: hypothetical protein LUD22_03900 [Coprobacillus sp.]|nr:hypothetical protein [Coprobacillus sp.]